MPISIEWSSGTCPTKGSGSALSYVYLALRLRGQPSVTNGSLTMGAWPPLQPQARLLKLAWLAERLVGYWSASRRLSLPCIHSSRPGATTAHQDALGSTNISIHHERDDVHRFWTHPQAQPGALFATQWKARGCSLHGILYQWHVYCSCNIWGAVWLPSPLPSSATSLDTTIASIWEIGIILVENCSSRQDLWNRQTSLAKTSQCRKVSWLASSCWCGLLTLFPRRLADSLALDQRLCQDCKASHMSYRQGRLQMGVWEALIYNHTEHSCCCRLHVWVGSATPSFHVCWCKQVYSWLLYIAVPGRGGMTSLVRLAYIFGHRKEL